jgi:monoamine oxidase
MSIKPKIYDIIILGGGIAGIYTTYQLLKKNPNLSILLLEATNRFGGRVYTTPKYHLEAGAGRFSSKHKHLLKLIKELGLENKIQKSSASAEYFPVNIQSQPVNHLTDLIATVVIASKLERKIYLQSVSFIDYAKTILSKEEIKYIIDSFGYYSELVIMNAHDAIELIDNLDPKNKFHVLQDGLSQIIEEMILKIKKIKPNQLILKRNHKVININRENNPNPIYSLETEDGKYFFTTKIIAALPKQVLEKLTFFKSLKSDLKKIECAPLCRIYSKFKDKDKKWFQNLPKFTTNNNLRMVIPINTDKGTIMISYTDNKYAEYWHDLYKKEGIEKIDQKIAENIYQSTKITIPKPLETMVYYWSCGVGYWGIEADSRAISQKMIKPFEEEEVYICGEHYSEKNQQWMEGALETSNSVLKKIMLK